MVPNSDCRMLLSIIGARKTRKVLQRGGVVDTDLPRWSAQLIDAAQRCGVGVEKLQRTVWRRSHRRRFGAIAEGKLDDVVADIAGPAGYEFGKTSSVVREQGPRGFLEMPEIPGHRRHEMIGGPPRAPAPLPIAPFAPPPSHHIS